MTTTLDTDGSDDAAAVWNETKRILRPQVADSVWFATFHDSEAVSGDKMSLLVRVPNAFARDRIQNRYKSLVRDALDQAGAEGRDLEIEVHAEHLRAECLPVLLRRHRRLRQEHARDDDGHRPTESPGGVRLQRVHAARSS